MALDWSNERYVRLYTRDTATWKLLHWKARALLVFMIRKVDRAGVIDVGEDGETGLAAMVEMDEDEVGAHLPALIKRGCVFKSGSAYVLPNFIAAQEAVASDKQRQRDAREKRRSAALSGITPSDTASRDVTEPSRGVTRGHAESRAVTPNQDKTNQAETRLTDTAPGEPALELTSPEPKKRRTRVQPVPATDPEPTDADRAVAAEFGVDLRSEWPAMFDWLRDKGIGTADPSARWRNWCRNHRKFRSGALGTSNHRPLTGLAATAEILAERAARPYVDPFKP